MDCRFAVCLLLVVQLSSAAELKLAGELHYNSLEVTLQNSADREVSFSLKLQLKEKTGGEWKTLEFLKCGVNSSVAPLDSRDFNCSYSSPAKPGQYKIYARASIIGGTYTYKDFLFNISSSGFAPGQKPVAQDLPANPTTQGFKAADQKKDVVVAILSAPEKVKTGEGFFVIVNITANKRTDLEIYSYVYSGKACYSFTGWKGNSKKYGFEDGESKILNLSDSVSHEASNGTYALKVRAREGAGDSIKDYDASREIGVVQVPADLFKEIPKASSYQKTNTGGGLPIHLLLPLIGSIPLAILLIRKIL